MTFRANESSSNGYEKALQYLIPRDIDQETKSRSRDCIREIVEQCGPIVDSYPDWHPLVTNHSPRSPVTTPGVLCGYQGLDHRVYFRNGFVTCPYEQAVESVLESVAKLPETDIATISAKRLDAVLYNSDAVPILVACEWKKEMLSDGTIPMAIAVPMILQREVPAWEWATRAEPWESMRPYFLGTPSGSRSSLFINQKTGSTIKKIWQLLIETGAFGPIKIPQD